MVTADHLKLVLDRLGYEFHTFELPHFIDHIEKWQRRKIWVIPWAFQLELSALWLPAPSTDYIFFNQNAHPVLQTHSILHEIAHILLEHPCRPIASVLPPELLAQLHTKGPRGIPRLADDQLRTTPAEQEAEAFVLLIQQRLVAANRLASLTGPSSSIDALRRWVDGMVFTD